jgi:hypothetical protein
LKWKSVIIAAAVQVAGPAGSGVTDGTVATAGDDVAGDDGGVVADGIALVTELGIGATEQPTTKAPPTNSAATRAADERIDQLASSGSIGHIEKE